MVAPPPDDPDTWTDEQWLEWLADVDGAAPPEPEGHPSRRHVRSLGGSLLGAAMLGMHRAIYGDTETDIVMVVDADGEPPGPEELEVHLDPEDPDASTVTVRPWLHEDHGEPDPSGPSRRPDGLHELRDDPGGEARREAGS